ncbi:MAG: hypothetical protein GF388_01790 [Candidatus Aegiribacteria sp.]|nr:hypothetical protein [Candidatus Aegiribacteria sp.]
MKTLTIIAIMLLVGCTVSQRQLTNEDKAWEWASVGAGIVNLATTENMLDRPGTWEANPVYPDRPSDTELVGMFLVSEMATIVFGRYDIVFFEDYKLQFMQPRYKAILNVKCAVWDEGVR